MGKPAKLIVVAAFDENEEGELGPAFAPLQLDSERKALERARAVWKDQHAGVVAWSREVNPEEGFYGEPKILFQKGRLPEME